MWKLLRLAVPLKAMCSQKWARPCCWCGFVAAAHVEHKAAVGNFGVQHLLVQQADAVGVFVEVVVSHRRGKGTAGAG